MRDIALSSLSSARSWSCAVGAADPFRAVAERPHLNSTPQRTPRRLTPAPHFWPPTLAACSRMLFSTPVTAASSDWSASQPGASSIRPLRCCWMKSPHLP